MERWEYIRFTDILPICLNLVFIPCAQSQQVITGNLSEYSLSFREHSRQRPFLRVSPLHFVGSRPLNVRIRGTAMPCCK